MLIYKNTSTLDAYDEGLLFTSDRAKADIALLGSKPINLKDFPNLKGIFRAGIGKDNVPIREAEAVGILVRFPEQNTIDLIYEETANFTCGLIFRMLYSNVGTLDPWLKNDRVQLQDKTLLVIGQGNIGTRVAKKMQKIMKIQTYDVVNNTPEDLIKLMKTSDCVSIHIPNIPENKGFMSREKLALMKDGAILINTARGVIDEEDALYRELANNRIRAAFDVYWQEPYQGKLKAFHPDRFFMTPHVASTCRGFLQGCRRDLDSLIGDLTIV